MTDAEEGAKEVRDDQADEAERAAERDGDAGEHGDPERNEEARPPDIDAEAPCLFLAAKKQIERGAEKIGSVQANDKERNDEEELERTRARHRAQSKGKERPRELPIFLRHAHQKRADRNEERGEDEARQ